MAAVAVSRRDGGPAFHPTIPTNGNGRETSGFSSGTTAHIFPTSGLDSPATPHTFRTIGVDVPETAHAYPPMGVDVPETAHSSPTTGVDAPKTAHAYAPMGVDVPKTTHSSPTIPPCYARNSAAWSVAHSRNVRGGAPVSSANVDVTNAG